MKQYQIGGMENKKNEPGLATVLIFYLLALGMIILQGPPLVFYFVKNETVGQITNITDKTVQLSFSDDKKTMHLVEVRKRNKTSGIKKTKGDEVMLFYNRFNPTSINVPIFQGSLVYLYNLFLILMGIYAAFYITREYIENKNKRHSNR